MAERQVDLSALLDFDPTPRQIEYIEAVDEHGTYDAAAQALGINPRTIYRGIEALKKKAARQGYSPDHDMVHATAPGFRLKGTSTLYTVDDEGRQHVSAQWVKTQADADQQAEIIKATVEAWCEAAKGAIKPVKAPKHSVEHLLTVYPMGDPHFGLYCWASEVGNNFDLGIAEQDLVSAVDYLVAQAPPSKRAVLANLGDFFHTDNMAGTTARSGHALDTDGRLHKMFEIGVRALRRCIAQMLKKHETVEVINVPGNHDHVLALAMNVLFGNLFDREPRLIVHNTPTMRHYVEHGKNLLGFVHGHETKDPQLPGIMATEKAEEWGRTKFRVFFRGHHHQDKVNEYNGCTVEQVRTLAPGDAYAVGSGYLSGQDMKAIVYHADYGEISRFTCGIDLLRAA